MVKKILVGIDTSEHSRNAQAYAFYFAWLFNATLIGLHVVDIVSIEGSFFHDISGSLGLEPYLDFSSGLSGPSKEKCPRTCWLCCLRLQRQWTSPPRLVLV